MRVDVSNKNLNRTLYGKRREIGISSCIYEEEVRKIKVLKDFMYKIGLEMSKDV